MNNLKILVTQLSAIYTLQFQRFNSWKYANLTIYIYVNTHK